jgi:hypothetical protein
MVIVMPAGHARQSTRFTPPPAPSSGDAPPPDEFAQDFVTDIMPYIEKHYRVQTDRNSRAIARLSIGLLGVQVHVGPPMKIEYRNFRLKKIIGGKHFRWS